MAAAGRIKVDITNRLGGLSGRSEANTPRTIPIEAPEPIRAAIIETIKTSFRRMDYRWDVVESSVYPTSVAAKNTIAFRYSGKRLRFGVRRPVGIFLTL